MSFLKQEELMKRTIELMKQLRNITLTSRGDEDFAREYAEAQYALIMALLDENSNLAMLVAELYNKEHVAASSFELAAISDKQELH